MLLEFFMITLKCAYNEVLLRCFSSFCHFFVVLFAAVGDQQQHILHLFTTNLANHIMYLSQMCLMVNKVN